MSYKSHKLRCLYATVEPRLQTRVEHPFGPVEMPIKACCSVPVAQVLSDLRTLNGVWGREVWASLNGSVSAQRPGR